MRRYDLQNVTIPEIAEEEWILEKQDGVFIVRLKWELRRNYKVHHVVFVEARRRMVWECVEKESFVVREN